jgi:hypothetical protein
MRYGEAGALIPAALVCMACVWHTSSREKASPLQEQRHHMLQHV